ncbi:ORM1-like protein 2 [Corticium candelabrum]|uniref:ORM1-like protein 2 n=1 Tax=Corticium candelabrum TaxID=121492 RepID=UPI002E26D9A0|nr:ORM1-like protein 2 [Corticium candelabrum]
MEAVVSGKPNTKWMNSRGIFGFYVLIVFLLYFVLLSVPFIASPVAWTLTHCIHSAFSYLFLHCLKGSPFQNDGNQGKSRPLTHWEQIDDGTHWTTTKKLLTIVPIALFFVASFVTNYSPMHFLVNGPFLALALLPKFPVFHKRRFFGINEY